MNRKEYSNQELAEMYRLAMNARGTYCYTHQRMRSVIARTRVSLTETYRTKGTVAGAARGIGKQTGEVLDDLITYGLEGTRKRYYDGRDALLAAQRWRSSPLNVTHLDE